MPRSVKINTFTFRIKKRFKKDLVGFDDFFSLKISDGTVIKHPFTDFFKKYVESFNGKFHRQLSSNKAINISKKKGDLAYSSHARYIFGTFKGGTTGYASNIHAHDKADSEEEVRIVNPEDVIATAYHFLLWFPANRDFGILMVQGYGDLSVADVLKNHLAAYIKQSHPDLMMVFGNYIDPELVEKFKKNAVVKRVVLRRRKLSSDKAKHITKLEYVPAGKLNVDIVITGLDGLDGFKERFENYVEGSVPELFEIDELKEYGIDGEHDTLVEFDSEGRRASGYKAKEFSIAPDHYISEKDVPCSINGSLDREKLKEYMLNQLVKIQTQTAPVTS